MSCIELDDNTWNKILTVLKNDKQTWRGKADDKRLFIDGMLYLLNNKVKGNNMSHLLWNTLPQKFGKPLTQSRKFERWRINGMWEKILPILLKEQKYQWLAQQGVYEILFRNYRLLLDISAYNKQLVVWDKEKLHDKLKEDFDKKMEQANDKHSKEMETLNGENYELKAKNLKLMNDLKESKKAIENEKEKQKKLNSFIQGLKEYTIYQRLKKKMQDELNTLKEERDCYKDECWILKMKDTTYRNLLHNHGYGYVRKAIDYYEKYNNKKYNNKKT